MRYGNTVAELLYAFRRLRGSRVRRLPLPGLGAAFHAGLVLALVMGSAPMALAQDQVAAPALGERLTQEMIAHELSLFRIRAEGRRIFATPFNRLDGFGDGPMNQQNRIDPGGRPGLQSSGQPFLRFNGLDSQTCLECHNILSNREIPATNAVGGAGGVSQSAFPGVLQPDIADTENNGFARIAGRIINPPFNFGAGGVELLAKEMTANLHALKGVAEANPGVAIPLDTHGVNFGTLRFDGSGFDTRGIEGVDDDLVVRPFGRKGCCQTVRQFDVGAMEFHHGIQPVEVVGDGDADGDGFVNEISVGEISALHIFQAALERPRETRRGSQARAGEALFQQIGCADCHMPELRTESRFLGMAFPEVETDPGANVYRWVDLSRPSPGFSRAGSGVRVRLFADLKRHDMGADMAESTGGELDRFFHTARLWGVADTAPYLHDGRATTLADAIEMHGGEGAAASDAFSLLIDDERAAIVAFLMTLRTPEEPSEDLADEDEDEERRDSSGRRNRGRRGGESRSEGRDRGGV